MIELSFQFIHFCYNFFFCSHCFVSYFGVKIYFFPRKLLSPFRLRPRGYGDYCSKEGEGIPVIIEQFQGTLRVVIWANINEEEPTHIISLEKAKETWRIK